ERADYLVPREMNAGIEDRGANMRCDLLRRILDGLFENVESLICRGQQRLHFISQVVVVSAAVVEKGFACGWLELDRFVEQVLQAPRVIGGKNHVLKGASNQFAVGKGFRNSGFAATVRGKNLERSRRFNVSKTAEAKQLNDLALAGVLLG